MPCTVWVCAVQATSGRASSTAECSMMPTALSGLPVSSGSLPSRSVFTSEDAVISSNMRP